MATAVSSTSTTMANVQLTRGILISSPTSSPRNSIFLSPPGAPPQRHSTGSQSSSASSSSSTDDISSSSEGNASSSTSRKIRFAPLPDPRRAVLVTEEGREVPLLTSTRVEAARSKTFPLTPLPAAPNALPVSSYFDSHLGSLSAEDLDSGQNTETNTIVGTDDSGSTFSLPPGTKRERGGKWTSRRIFGPFLKASKVSNMPSLSTEEILTLGTINLFRSTSRESDISNYSTRSAREYNNSGYGAPLQRHMSQPTEGEERREARRVGAVVYEPGASGKGTRMLNGRVYGGRRMSEGSRVDEPEFVEWGQGGMGSVIGGSGHKGENDDEDDGSGLAWVKRRRAQKDKDTKQRAEVLAHKDGVGGGGTEEDEVAESPKDENLLLPLKETHSAPPTIRVHRADSAEHEPLCCKIAAGKEIMSTMGATPPSGASTPRGEEHETTVIEIPVHGHHHHHHHHHHRSDSPSNLPLVSNEQVRVASPLKEEIVSETGSTSGSSNMSEEDEDDDDDDGATEKDPKEVEETTDDTDEDEVDEEEEEQKRLTSLSAGVEKIARHKE